MALGVSPANGTSVSQTGSTRFGTTADEQASSVARMIGGIISYSRWPGRDDAVTICTMGNTRFAKRLGDARETAGRAVAVRTIGPGSSAAAQGCDILYLGATTPALQQKAIGAVHGQPVLSIAEADPSCRGGAMFCILVQGGTLTFRLNVDAISRGTVRVDPRVLRLFSQASGKDAA